MLRRLAGVTMTGMSKRILLLFQDGSATQDLLQAIALRGYQVTLFSGLRGVVERVVLQPPDLIVIGLDRPDVDGRDLARLIRRDARCAAVPIALCLPSPESGTARLQKKNEYRETEIFRKLDELADAKRLREATEWL